MSDVNLWSFGTERVRATDHRPAEPASPEGVANAQKEEERRARKELAAARRTEEAIRFTQEFRHHVTRAALDVLVPEHGRTSCSDDNRINGFGPSGGYPRCDRCALLDMLIGDAVLPGDFTVRLIIED
jgi:hypothetical protein